MNEPTFTGNRYPTEATLATIAKWSYPFDGLYDYLHAAWQSDYGRIFDKSDLTHFVTGGWSGNESIIEAMRENQLLWSLCWQSSHRGGLTVMKFAALAEKQP